jgi:hypothetical protein
MKLKINQGHIAVSLGAVRTLFAPCHARGPHRNLTTAFRKAPVSITYTGPTISPTVLSPFHLNTKTSGHRNPAAFLVWEDGRCSECQPTSSTQTQRGIVHTAGTHNKLKYVTGPLVVVVVVVAVAAAAAANSCNFARFNSHLQNTFNLYPSSLPTFRCCTLDDSEGRVYNSMEENGRGLF